MTIEEFEAARIDPVRFDHEAHVYVAWQYVGRHQGIESAIRFDTALRRLTTKFGIRGKYHATITWLFLLLIRERFLDGEPWLEFRTRNEDLIADAGRTLARYYSPERLASKEARERFVLPDRLPS